jgi:serine/threonine protein kinase
MGKLKDVGGILPVIDSGLPARPSLAVPAWLAMPLAEPLSKSPAIASLEALVEAFFEIAATLAQLARRGIAHRDIKPDNLFWFANRPAVGDFGLADFPGKEALTVSGRKLGPMFYIAPEMLNDPDTADGCPADVYSLAKSLWVMATGQTYPPPGEHRESVYGMRISTYLAHRKARYLDKLVSSCTAFDPDARPTMETVTERLKAWPEQPEPTGPIRPRHFAKRELAKVGVQIADPHRIILRCSRCGQGWSPNLKSGGKLPRNYWKCPNHCNY